MGFHTEIWPASRALFFHQKGWNLVIHGIVDGTVEHYVK